MEIQKMQQFDYIVVGAGSAGCVVANRLSADENISVLVLEAGGADWHPMLRMPFACGKMFYHSSVNWDYESEPEMELNHRRITRAAGRVLGGSSSINGLVYTRGHAGDYDEWASLGCDGWSHNDVLPYFRRAESHWRGASDDHGGDGPLTLSRHHADSYFDSISRSAAMLGHAPNDDFSRNGADGFGIPEFTVHRGRRASTYRRYLHPIRRRPNLKISRGCLATKIIVERGRAVGVEYLRRGKRCTVFAASEVIVSSGAYNSPKLLMLSGIGPADGLRKLGIQPLVDLPGVGSNLQEHPGTAITFQTTELLPFDNNLRLDRMAMALLRWSVDGSGPIGGLPFLAMGFCRTSSNCDRPDVELLFTPASLNARLWMPGWRKPNGKVLTTGVWLMRPKSRGSVRLRSSDPRDAPCIELNLLSASEDRRALVRGLEMAREILSVGPAAELVAHEAMPGTNLYGESELLRYARATLGTMQHPVGTCAMGIDHQAVVDPALKVRGLDGLRVIDASIMPLIVGGHTNGPTIMIGEKGSDLVLGDNVANRSGCPNQG